jgi:tartrate dehydrogenase/decarboxylase/D-malate dehydrogenase
VDIDKEVNTMKDYSIALIPGDGIGQEVAPEGVRVLNAVGELTGEYRLHYDSFPWGCEHYLAHGEMMANDGLRLPICQGFEQYVCLRPSQLLPGIKSPLADKKVGDIDFVVIRENTEGEYAGAGGRAHRGLPIEVAVETSVFSRVGVERIVRYAYKLAQSRPRHHLVSATKSNAQQHSLTFWDEIFAEVGREYPEVTTERVLIDALSARFVLRPESLDVVVGSNLFGDILTDLGGAICGSLGMAASGNINPEHEYPSMFEPVHGSAPDIFGKGIANPVAMIWSGAMMLEHLGAKKSADLILKAIRAVTGEGRVRTPDLGGNARTLEMTDAVIRHARELVQ